MKTTLLKLIAPVIAIIALVGEQFDITFTADQLDTLIAAVAIIVTAVQNGIRPTARTANSLALFLLPVAIACTALMPTGCSTVEKVWSDTPEIAKVLIKSSLRTAVYLITKNNPELAPWLTDYAGFLRDIPGAVAPDELKPYALDQMDNLIVGTPVEDKLPVLRQIVSEAMDIYAIAYAAYQPEITSALETELIAIIGQLAAAVEDGANLATSTFPASGPSTFTGEFVTIIIE